MADWYSWYSVFKAREANMLIRLKHPGVKKRSRPHPGRLAARQLLIRGHLIGPGEMTGGAEPRSVPHV
jgi:hypothetical protein